MREFRTESNLVVRTEVECGGPGTPGRNENLFLFRSLEGISIRRIGVEEASIDISAHIALLFRYQRLPTRLDCVSRARANDNKQAY
jgi:hypothetical protein